MNAPSAFTLVEVLVALVVAALLASGLLAVQRHGLNQARRTDALWEHMNLAQEALMGQELARIKPGTSTSWTVRVEPPTPERPGAWALLETRIADPWDRIQEWTWPLAGQ